MPLLTTLVRATVRARRVVAHSNLMHLLPPKEASSANSRFNRRFPVTVRRSHLPDPGDKDDVLHLKIRGQHRPYLQDYHAPKNFLPQTL